MLNSPETLQSLRTDHRVHQPSFAKHPLIRAAKRLCGIPVYFHNKKRVKNGDAPGDALYDDGALYLGPYEHDKRNGIWHELCHVMVATKVGTLSMVNFDSSDDDEMLACKIELWLGFMTGYYTYEQMVHFVFDYNFDDNLKVKILGEDEDLSEVRATWVSAAQIERFLQHCRKQALRVPLACKLAEILGVGNEETLKDKTRPLRAKYK